MQRAHKLWQFLLVIGFVAGNISVALADQAQPRNISSNPVGSELSVDAVAMHEELQALVRQWGLEVENFSMSVSVVNREEGEYGINSSCESCTITATISIPGGTGIQVSATASDCLGAWGMIVELARELGASILR